MMIASLIISLNGFVAVFAIVAIAIHMMFFRRLQLRCPEEWERLGSAKPFLPNDVRTGRVLTNYIMRGRFAHIRDHGVVTLGWGALCSGGDLGVSMDALYCPGAFRCYPCVVTLDLATPSNQSMKPTAPTRNEFNVFATTPCRGLSLSR